MTPAALYLALAIGLGWLVGTEVVHGAQWVGRAAKKGGTAIVHLLKKIPHPHQEEPKQ